jgi:mannose-1-phosphate guanylyltransferase/mannose-6-phosphate isomerase
VLAIATKDAILVADKDHAQDVKAIVDKLKASGRKEAVEHKRVYRPWGWYEQLSEGNRFQVKALMVNPGAKLSLQSHFHRAEHWIVVSGTAEVTNGDEVKLLSENESTYIPIGTRHRLGNPGKLPAMLIEVQSGSYLGEDDIERYDDDFGRHE